MEALARTASPSGVNGRPAPDDHELVALIRAGKDSGFALLVDRYWEKLFRLVLGIVGDWHRSEDVLQEVMVLVYRKIGSFDGRSSLLTWLYRIAVNAALKSRRRARRHAFMPLDGGLDQKAPGAPLGRDVELQELGEKVLRCLPAKLRAVILLREWEGLGYEDISRVLGISRGAVEQRIHRALVELRRVWKPAAREEWLHGL